ncbi:divisome-associated lipoprotein YraP [Haemophilus parahaemolyticus]|uniref:Divisome-associated lipoprotein YraP n=2 Tax=Haemophilus parahaemolyticus TaxID=735 RepID=A0AAE6JS45_HAEPH|nr:division/outer membrane stress-associated lipid-binding lipoprotein [Haemophilus parahaemolyticus]EIJ69205.1 BON domain protein [Haemophilus parahaemolyticus HK385]MDU4465458.1 division/outer membrane stress-associated lipid-binding lipoprotein [Haemophilus parahaemolyticus]OOR95716.1 osmotically-inducible protein OsmY [Haemophilus parahaemolyticus]QEN11211.1 divisome-associated lipoprotein YraP [Haemophilus parahaemolyticus]QRP12406.1 divisome-associated lipoprotein YraP [Haemophilus parah
MKTLIKKTLSPFLLGAVLLLLQGCITTAVVTTAAVAGKVATDPRSAGTQVDDEILEEKVAQNLNNDAQLKTETRINVVVYNGKVLLIGQAPNYTAAETAKNIAAGVEGVKEVVNEIRTGEVIRASQVAIDSWITTTIKSKLLLNGEVKTTEVKVITENGEVFLIGKLSHTQADAATEVARNVRGVSKVVKVITYAM